MNYRFFLLLVLFLGTGSLSGFQKSQFRDSVIVKRIYTVCYSEVLEQPEWVKYKVMCPSGQISRKGMRFYKEKNIHTSDDQDYENNEWDKGHMAPAASFNCDEKAMRSTFSYLNSALQQESLNRGVWKNLETYERKLAERYTVEVFIDIEFSEITRVQTGAAIPTGFYKELRYDGKKESFFFPNKRPSSSDPNDFRCNPRYIK